jgi:hypothetical protein
MRTIAWTAVTVSAFMLPRAVLAHHSFAAHFLMDTVEEAEGRITDVKWTNPHAFIYIEDAAGEKWELELGPVNLLLRLGIERDMLVIGETIRARGNPGRRAWSAHEPSRTGPVTPSATRVYSMGWPRLARSANDPSIASGRRPSRRFLGLRRIPR